MIQRQQAELRQSAKGVMRSNGVINFNSIPISMPINPNGNGNFVSNGQISYSNVSQNILVSPKSGLFQQAPKTP